MGRVSRAHYSCVYFRFTSGFGRSGQPESWGILWDERYKGRLGMLASGADSWCCAAIYAGVDFSAISTEENLKLVAAMTWDSSAVLLKKEGVPTTFAKPKEGALTWVCGAMIHKDAPHLDKAHDVVDWMLSVESGVWLIDENGYGHSNRKSFDAIPDARLAELGLSRNPVEILGAGKFQIPQTQAFETKMNQEFEQIKAGF